MSDLTLKINAVAAPIAFGVVGLRLSGAPGADGDSATVDIGTVTTGAAGSSASVTNSGTPSAAILNFAIPKGDKGNPGDKGDPGTAGKGIAHIDRTSGDGSAGTTDTYTITYDDATTSEFYVYNGSNGADGADATNPIITANSDASPALGTVVSNHEYRCANTSLTTAPTMTFAAISSTATEFACSVIFKAPDATVPVITNDSGYTLKYSGQDVSSGVWTPVAATVYRMSVVFDGIYVNIYISGVA